MSYLPKQLDEKEIEIKIKELANKIGAETKADFGKLMSSAMKELKGKADGKIVKTIVEKVLNKS
jgi:uncharacterized protein YqeY